MGNVKHQAYWISGSDCMLAMILRFRAVILCLLSVFCGFFVIARDAAFCGMTMFFSRFVAALCRFCMMFRARVGRYFIFGCQHK
jgi:hypothetical protein